MNKLSLYQWLELSLYLLILLALASCGGAPPNTTQVCAEVTALAPLVPLVSAADLAIPTAGPAVAAANNMLAAAANGTCADPAAVQALVTQLQGVIVQAKTQQPVASAPKP